MSKTLIVRSDLDNRQLLCNFIYVTCLVQDACREAHRLRQDDNKRLFDAFIDCIKEFIPLRDGLQREILSRMNNKSKPSGLTIRPDEETIVRYLLAEHYKKDLISYLEGVAAVSAMDIMKDKKIDTHPIVLYIKYAGERIKELMDDDIKEAKDQPEDFRDTLLKIYERDPRVHAEVTRFMIEAHQRNKTK